MKAQYVARFAHNGRTHKIRDGWTYSNISNARTVCGRKGPFGIEHLQSGTHLDVTCLSCTASEPGVFNIEVTRTSYHVVSDEVDTWTTDPHRVDTDTMEYDDDMAEDYVTPVDWAVGMLSNERVVATPGMSGFPDLNPSASPIGPVARPHEWLSGTAADNYTTEQTEWSVYLTSDGWTDEQRAEVFRRVTNTP